MKFQRAFLDRWEPGICISGADTGMPQALLDSVALAFPLLQQHNRTPEAAPCADSYLRYPWLSIASLGNDGIWRALPYCFHHLLCVEIGFLRSASHETLKK